MARVRFLATVVACALVLGAAPARADSLADLLPNLFGTGGITLLPPPPPTPSHAAHFTVASEAELTVLNDSLRRQLANLPLPSPVSSFTFRFDPSLGTFTRTTESFGPIYAQRAETTGRGKFTFGFTYSHFSFDQLDGKDLDNGELQVTFQHEPTGASLGMQPFTCPPRTNPNLCFESDVITARIFADITSDVFVLSGTYGILDNLDVSIAIPIIRNEIDLKGIATIQRIGTGTNTAVHRFDQSGTDTLVVRASGESTGFGDIVLRGKYNFYRTRPLALAAGLDVRLPTGDRDELRGVGTVITSPSVIASAGPFFGVAPHVNLGFHASGDTSRIEHEFFYNVGFDWAVIRRLTFAFDVLGRRVIDNDRIEAGSPPGSGKIAGSDVVDVALGLKANVFKDALVVVNVLVPLNDTGLRDNVTPLIGIEIPF